MAKSRTTSENCPTQSFLEVIRLFLHYRIVWREMLFLLGGLEGEGKAAALLKIAIRESF